VIRATSLVFACGLLSFGANSAETYPARPIRLIVASAPAGGTDFVARATNARLSEFLGSQVVIDNRGGVGGLLACELVARASADGYTLLTISSNFVALPSLHKKLPFDVIRDFAPVANVVATPWILVVNPTIPATSVSQLIEYVRAKKGAINYATSGIGSFPHLAAELFKSVAKVEIEHVAYKGGGPATLAVLGNESQLYFSTIPSALSQIKAGRLRALGVTSPKRSVAAPQVPTFLEQGVPLELVGWFGIFAPAKTPRAVVDLLNATVNKVVALPETSARLLAEGTEPANETAKEFSERVKQDVKKWGAAVAQAGISAQ